ncbi:MAG: NTP transferase domain-containing protein [Phycisphaerae bacterium]|nr:NTP transferase domain-containing protein [Phycisphaerae bacterium]
MNYAVIMAGGSGQRLWPLSRKARPKQMIDIFNGKSLLQLCVDRIKPVFEVENIIVITNQEYVSVVREHLSDIPPKNIIGEPVGRDTLNAIGLAAAIISKNDPEATMAVFGADQIIEPAETLQDAIKYGLKFIADKPEALITFAIKPDAPHTGFGYLKHGSASDIDNKVFTVAEFKEKPDAETARQYLKSRQYSWNSGMFAWRVATINALIARYLPENHKILKIIAGTWQTESFVSTLNAEFHQLMKISIDYGIMERAENVYMLELDCKWKDVGSYQALAEIIAEPDINNNRIIDNTCCEILDSSNNIIISEMPDHAIVAIDVDNLVIVETEKTTLVCHRDKTDKLKQVLENMANAEHEKYL